MISVTFTADVENIVATEHLYQWDNGQKLSISGVGTTADIHFVNKKSEKALVVTPTVTSGAMEAPIPNSLLAEPYPIIAYVYAPSDNGSKTIKTVTIGVEARKQPSEFILEEDEGVTTLETISQKANEILQNANEVLQNATNQINTSISDMQTDYTNFKNTIQAELDNMKANTTVPNADTLDNLHASDFVQTSSLTHNVAVGEKPASTVTKGIYFTDKNKKLPFGKIQHALYADGSSGYAINAVNNVSSGQKTVFIAMKVSGDGSDMYVNVSNPTSPAKSALRNISVGTAEANTTNCPAAAVYGQYE